MICTKCQHDITEKHCNQCIKHLAEQGIVWTQFGVCLKGEHASKYRGPLLRVDEAKLIIQLLGQARSGKDWTASQLKAYFESQGKSVEIMSYAAPMKRITATLFGITLEQLDDFKNRDRQVSIEVYDHSKDTSYYRDSIQIDTNFRTFLQRLGNEAMKSEFGDAVWADLAKQHISKSTADIIIIPDCRFTVELSTIGGTTVRVVNTALPAPMNHASELELADTICMYMLDNTNYKATEHDIVQLAQRVINES